MTRSFDSSNVADPAVSAEVAAALAHARELWERERAALVQQRDMLAALLERETRFRAAADTQAVFMFRAVRNDERRIVDFELVDVSAGAVVLAGITREAAIGQRLSELSSAAMTSGLFDRYVRVAETGIALDEEYRSTERRTRAAWLWLHIVPLSIIDDTISVTVRDISERKEAERTKNQLIGMVSHELRTPLTVIHGALGLLAARTDRPPQEAKLIDMATRHTSLLIRLLNDLLDVERIESGMALFTSQQLPALPLMHHAVELVHRLADEAGITLHLERNDTSRNATVWADPDRVTQVLVNLLNNAVKFSPAGSTVTTGIGGNDATDDDFTLFWVRDEGRGIPADRLDHVFNRFVQVDNSDAKDKHGAGLGLAICRAIVRQHGGRIWVESKVGRGSTFYFTLPRTQLTAPPRAIAVTAE